MDFLSVLKSISEKDIAENVLKWGTGGINIDGCRVDVSEEEKDSFAKEWDRFQSGSKDGTVGYVKQDGEYDLNQNRPTGRFPANFIHDGGDEVVRLFPETISKYSESKSTKATSIFFKEGNINPPNQFIGDQGSAARFFYCAKAPPSERNEGLEGLE